MMEVFVAVILASLPLLGGCDTPARFEKMVVESIGNSIKQPYALRVRVTGGHDTEAVGRPQIPDSAFAQALVETIIKSGMFAKVTEQSDGENYLLTVTLFALDKRLFDRTVKLQAGWTLQRVSDSTTLWRELIVSEAEDFDVRVGTEKAAKNNISQGLAKLSQLTL